MAVPSWINSKASQVVERLRALPAGVILGIGFALFLVYAFPGYMSSDSVMQMLEGRSHRFTSGHPPIMAAEWGVLDAIVSGPILMLLLQGLLFVGGAFAVLRRFLTPRAAAVVADLILLFPPVLTTMAVIWKDSQMAAYLVAGIAALLSKRPGVRIMGWVLITAGCAFRYNAFAATVPLVFLLFEWRPGFPWFARYGISLAAAIASVMLAFGINRALEVKHEYLAPGMADIVGVLAYTDDRSDEDLRHVLRDTSLRVTTSIQATARMLYSERNPYRIDHGDNRIFDPPKTELQRIALTRAWKEIVSSDWNAYFSYRIAGYRELLGLSEAPLWAPVWNAFNEAPEQVAYIHHDASQSWAQNRLGLLFATLADETPLFRPYLYTLLALLLVAVVCRDRLTLALFASGLGYELSFFPAAGTPDFRYSHWLIATTCLATVILFVQRLRVRTRESS